MKTFNSLMKKRDRFERHWNQMVGVNDPEREVKPYWEDRCIQQLKMAGEYAKHHDSDYTEIVERVSAYVANQLEQKGYITEDVCREVESRLAELGASLKKIKVHCVSHAHIDMNWLWGYHETVEVVLATLETIVTLMHEYPDFTYAQSQGAVYRIVETFDPQLLDEIRVLVKEGRWEVTSATWVEHDKNMTGSESFARQLLYTRSYLCSLLDMDPGDIVLGFEPDTFGHSAFVPEVLSQAGIKYYYHCRGLDDKYLYRWASPSGKDLLAYREPVWYGNSVTSGAFCHIPMVAKETKALDTLFVYGVGDHGGGPSRQDIEQIIAMNEWPLMPDLSFSSYRRYFEAVEGMKDDLPEVVGEINPLLTGCYTSTARIKMANHFGEASLVSTEIAASVASHIFDHPYAYDQLEGAWEKHMFNQFHDILPGCGINFTKEHALGNFQELIASNNVIKRKALEAISSEINTGSVCGEITLETAESAGHGVGFKKKIGDLGVSFNTGLTSRGRFGGSTRLFALYNLTQYSRRESVELVLWDYRQDTDAIQVYDSQDTLLPFTIDESGFNQYWGHYYLRLMVHVEIQGFGYEVIRVSDDGPGHDASIVTSDPRKPSPLLTVLENESLRVSFDPMTMDMTSMILRSEDRELLSSKGGNFRFVKEDGKKSSAWVIGRYMSVDDCIKEVKDVQREDTDLYSSLSFKMTLNRSEMTVTYTLGRWDKHLHVNVISQWNELGSDHHTPQLQYRVELKESCYDYKFNVPMGLVARRPLAYDLPGLDFAYADCGSRENIYIGTDSKYGYRATEDYLALNLLRSSRYPNTHPDNETHHMDFMLGVGKVEDAYRQTACLNMPLETVNIPIGQKGSLSMKETFLTLEGKTSVVTSLKKSQDGEGLILKMYQSAPKDETLTLTFTKPVREAWITDILEEPLKVLESVSGCEITLISEAKSLTVIKAVF